MLICAKGSIVRSGRYRNVELTGKEDLTIRSDTACLQETRTTQRLESWQPITCYLNKEARDRAAILLDYVEY